MHAFLWTIGIVVVIIVAFIVVMFVTLITDRPGIE